MTETPAHYTIEKPLHDMSIERLYHFRCHHCQGWWTIADWQPVESVYCPHCGTNAKVKEIPADV